MALENFAREVEAGTRKRILLALDRARWHTAKKLRVPEGIHLEFLPSHSPELQPSERLWALSDEAVANCYFEEIEDLEEALVERYRKEVILNGCMRRPSGDPLAHLSPTPFPMKLTDLILLLNQELEQTAMNPR